MSAGDERYFGYAAALLAAAIGVVSALSFDRAEPGRVAEPSVGLSKAPDRDRAAATTTADIEEGARRRRGRALLAEHIPEVALAAWHGVLLRAVGAQQQTPARWLSDRDGGGEEGPPLHFAVSGDAVASSIRWRRQRPWHVSTLPEPTGWIVVDVLNGTAAEAATHPLILALRDQACRGAVAMHEEGEAGAKVVVEPVR